MTRLRTLLAASLLIAGLCPAIAADQVSGQAAPAAAPATQAATANNKAVVEKGVTGAVITVPASSEPQQYQIDPKPLIEGLLPYIVSAVGGLITVIGGLVALWVKQKFNVDIDSRHREAWQQAAQNAAGALIAKGAVEVENATGKITVRNEDMAHAVNMVLARVPDAVAHFGFTPDDVQHLVVAKIPQVLTGATPPAKGA